MVEPPAGLNVQPQPVFMGQEVNPILRPGSYYLLFQGDKVEPWVHFATPLGTDEPKKIGERFAFDSPRCRVK
ncbi:MAG: hypothetical protein A2831_02595 [Candidatus Yanofskybacteria bacterium RIFCSPHIGHO2_01_FULL_44_17]|uniref:Uncharacterized protein n=1 Tax=Candidatus Yanofskybacteria bacterium RIFCSPHIGHO2_01_FULL_44_17 TaxID=1802668 RepID=A0A1F8EXZ8_9BACT|nr:MAG: hypothetical protein A2831_02595 [Candidatus Yanofskybacteria bacterium RIFCSPHIGHO2_01_FULL_44_17]